MRLLALIVSLLSVSSAIGEEAKRPRFGIYMPKLDVYTETSDVQDRVIAYERTDKPSEIPLAEHPIVSEDDVLDYDWETHTLHLRNSLWFTIRQPGMHGLPFVVVADGVPIYVGAFWSDLSSIPSPVPVIRWDNEKKSKEITILKASTTKENEQSKDLRANLRINKVLHELGKLKAPAK